jgi:hypothetical protein
MPGFTPTSLLPEAAGHAAIPFVDLVDRLIRRAYARGVEAGAARPQVYVADSLRGRSRQPAAAARKTA